jgi:hypothetical protein
MPRVRLQDRFVPELVTATGSGLLGSPSSRFVLEPLTLSFSSRYITSISFDLEA